jgi:hypothetical protein
VVGNRDPPKASRVTDPACSTPLMVSPGEPIHRFQPLSPDSR